MKRKITIVALGATLFALCFPAEAQQPKKIPLIGYLSPGDPATDSELQTTSIRSLLR
jgi:hypothetical protein